MNHLMVEKMQAPPPLIWNCDATNFTVGTDNKGKTSVIFRDESDNRRHRGKQPLKCRPEDSNPSGLQYSIKYYLLMSAFGVQKRSVFVIQNECMEKEDFHCYEINGLGVGTDDTATGWIVFCKSRQCNLVFYKWCNSSILIPAVRAARQYNNIPLDVVA